MVRPYIDPASYVPENLETYTVRLTWAERCGALACMGETIKRAIQHLGLARARYDFELISLYRLYRSLGGPFSWKELVHHTYYEFTRNLTGVGVTDIPDRDEQIEDMEGE